MTEDFKDLEDEILSWTPEKREQFNKEADRLLTLAENLLKQNETEEH